MAERETERTVKKRAESDPAYQWHIQDLYASDEIFIFVSVVLAEHLLNFSEKPFIFFRFF